jgi:hypothetical protein
VRPGRIDAAPLGAEAEVVTVVPDSLSDFARLVATVRRELTNNCWVLHSDQAYLRFPPDWYSEYDARTGRYTSPQLAAVDRHVLARSEYWLHVRGEFLEAVANTLVDEWWDFFAVKGHVADLEAWVRTYWARTERHTLESYLTKSVKFLCAGIDGVRWDFFSEDPATIAAIQSHAESLPGFQVRATSLHEYLQVFCGQQRGLPRDWTTSQKSKSGASHLLKDIMATMPAVTRPRSVEQLLRQWPGERSSLRLYRRAFRDIMEIGLEHQFLGGRWRSLMLAANNVGLFEYTMKFRRCYREALLRVGAGAAETEARSTSEPGVE